MCFFSLLTVCLNPGEKLRGTLESALRQTCEDFELIVKDGGSSDGSLEKNRDLLSDPRVRVYTEKDTGIYDAMNQAVSHASGKYLFFLNCGDMLYDENVLEKVKQAAEEDAQGLEESSKEQISGSRTGESCAADAFPEREERTDREERQIFYGDVFGKKNQVWITPPPSITGFTCYRHVPCHQACFYGASLCKEKPFETKYKIRGDYEHFLWCFYCGKAKMRYLAFPVAAYEGGGYSETKESLKRSKVEHKEITARYMKKAELIKYRSIMLLTLAPLRTYLAENPHSRFSGLYSRLLTVFYRGRSNGR